MLLLLLFELFEIWFEVVEFDAKLIKAEEAKWWWWWWWCTWLLNFLLFIKLAGDRDVDKGEAVEEAEDDWEEIDVGEVVNWLFVAINWADELRCTFSLNVAAVAAAAAAAATAATLLADDKMLLSAVACGK